MLGGAAVKQNEIEIHFHYPGATASASCTSSSGQGAPLLFAIEVRPVDQGDG